MKTAKTGAAPPPFTGSRVDRIGVVIPVHNEEDALPHCLSAMDVAATRVAVPVTVIVVLDACTDNSAAVVRAAQTGVEAIVVDANSVGCARAAGMAELLRRDGQSGTWLATTDGDSVVPPNWLGSQLRHADAGARVVIGTVVVKDWEDRSAAVRDRAIRDYRMNHNHIHGANLSFDAAAYHAAGGFRLVTHDEDVRLVQAFKANSEAIAWAVDLPVVTSARRRARAPRGFSSYLSSLEGSLEGSRDG